MPFQKNKTRHEASAKRFNKGISKNKNDVVDRFLSILWKKEVDYKMTTK